MSTFTVRTNCGTGRDFESRSEAERGKETHLDLCETCEEADVRIVADAGRFESPVETGTTESNGASPDGYVSPAGVEEIAESFDGVPDSMLTDPLDVLPEYMIDVVEGQPTINKRGYAVIANHFDIVVQAEAITTAGETDHEYAEFVARAWRKADGPENAYTGHATARASEDRRSVADNLNEMAETRAMKRAVAWASGVGILAWEELSGYAEKERAAAP